MISANAPVLIAGGGIGGLTCALALARAGYRVELFEHAGMLSEIGAGLQLSPNASRILEKLGVMQKLEGQLGLPDSLSIYSGSTGAPLAQMPLGQNARERWGADYAVAHRSDLQSALVRACDEETNITTHLGCEIVSYDTCNEGVALSYLRNGTRHIATGAGLIGADGIWSQVRAEFLNDGAPRATGFNAYRAMIPANALPHDLPLNASGLWMAPDAHIVHYPLREATLINIVVILRDAVAAQGWNSDVDLEEFYIATAHLPRVARELLRAPQSWTRWPIYDRPASQAAWPNLPVTLLGDAAHPMLPFLAQGAAQAIEDAEVLATCVRLCGDDLVSAFQSYRNTRHARLARIQRETERNRNIFHMRGVMALARDTVLKLSRKQSLLARYDWLYGNRLKLF